MSRTDAEAAADLQRYGFLVLDSSVLERQVVLTRDDRVNVPAPWADLPRWSMAEALRIADSPQAREVLEVACTVKLCFPQGARLFELNDAQPDSALPTYRR